MTRVEVATELKAILVRAGVLADLLAAAEPVATVQAEQPGDPGFADAAGFYDWLRGDKMLGPKISSSEYAGCKALTTAMNADGWSLAWAAYGLATPYLETAATMQPIGEYGGNAYFKRMYDIKGARPAKARELGNLQPGDGVLFHGRGYVQLTGRANYRKAGEALGLALEAQPEQALRPDVAADIMVRGMRDGWFTGKKMNDYLPADAEGTQKQFRDARRIINGLDRAEDIADYALRFQKALAAGGWK